MIEIIGAVVTLIGSMFLFLGALGLIRMPDVYNRIQAGTKATTLGAMLSLLGIGIIHLDWYGKLIVLIVFVLVSNPISSHVLAGASHHIGIPLSKESIVDKLKKKSSLTVKKDNVSTEISTEEETK
ncbi:MAG: monovalent cation/H(+) antiporter subunit G [Bacteroidota bacterium]|nr:monovalent cation/H(+) antiporter subunit G [Bacteroidota bacterium]